MTSKGKSWKNWEAFVCSIFGGKRRGADYSDSDGGKNDCIQTPGWSVETKYMATMTYSTMLEDALKARARAKDGEIPVAVMRRKFSGKVLDTTLVCMTLRDFMEHFVNTENVSEEPTEEEEKENA